MHGSENNDGNIVSRASPASYSRRELRVEQRTFRCDRAYGAKQACVISQVWQQQALDCITRHGAGISHDAIDAPGLLIRCPVEITFDLVTLDLYRHRIVEALIKAVCLHAVLVFAVGQFGDRITHGSFATRKERSEEHTSELQSLMRISYAVFCLKKKKQTKPTQQMLETKHHNRHTSIQTHKNNITID